MKVNKKLRYKMSDIAKESGVSITTVSHIINKTRHVKPATAKKVLETIKKRNYFKSISASSLRGKKTKLIGLIIPDVSNPIFGQLSKNLEDAFYEKGYNITICSSGNDFGREVFYLNVLKSRYVDGIIMLPVRDEGRYLKDFINNAIPLIILDRKVKNLDTDFILIDNFSGFYDATKYLINLGHKKIGYIERPYDLSHNVDRSNGYKQALIDNNIEFNEEHFVRSEGFSLKDGFNSMERILNCNKKPTAVLAFDDVLAIGAMRAIKVFGYRIPEDFSVIGFDDHIINEFLTTSLTAVELPTQKMAEKSVELFLSKIDDIKKPGQKIILIPSLKIRESTSSPRRVK